MNVTIYMRPISTHLRFINSLCHQFILITRTMMTDIPAASYSLVSILSLLGIKISVSSKLLRDELFERGAVPPVLDVILAPRRVKYLDANLNPSLPEIFVPPPQLQIVLTAEGEVVDRGIQIIHPAIAYLLPCSSWQLGGQIRPLRERRNGGVAVRRRGRRRLAMLLLRGSRQTANPAAGEYDTKYDGVLLLPPLPLSAPRPEVPRPPVVALPCGTPGHAVFETQCLPVNRLRFVIGHHLSEARILLWRPAYPGCLRAR